MPKSPDITERLGQKVASLRKKRNLSQEDLAELCQLDRTYISGIERGKRNVALRNIEKIAKALNVSISELTKGL